MCNFKTILILHFYVQKYFSVFKFAMIFNLSFSDKNASSKVSYSNILDPKLPQLGTLKRTFVKINQSDETNTENTVNMPNNEIDFSYLLLTSNSEIMVLENLNLYY